MCVNDKTAMSPCVKGEIILYSQSTINAYSLLSHKLWVPLIKFMMRPTIHVRGKTTHL